MLVIPATKEVEIERISVQGKTCKKLESQTGWALWFTPGISSTWKVYVKG
jgi:hypothetical protein